MTLRISREGVRSLLEMNESRRSNHTHMQTQFTRGFRFQAFLTFLYKIDMEGLKSFSKK